ncbi:MAG: hypothetical protein M1814_000871 [Vezdaea aestivalis]|nr:MAG: hypothetical protein M1814_000871 [Vezdaea aestivalis]
MSEASPTITPSQKRPLEEPSSPSGANDQPDAKRPALKKIVKTDPENGNGNLSEAGVNQDANFETLNPSVSNGVKIGQVGVVLADTSTGLQQIQTTTSSQEPASVQSPGAIRDETNWLHLRAVITSTEAATIIGKGGENVTLVRKMSGAKCTVSEYSRGAVERILTLSGEVDWVAKAFGLVIRTMNNESLEGASTPQSKTYPLRLLIPHQLIGSIIGKSGVRIREIQEHSGARLNVSDSCMPLSTERSLIVLGVADAVHIATYYVGTTLVEQLNERFSGPAASAYAGRTGGPVGPIPGGLQVVPYIPQAAGGSYGNPDSVRRHHPQQRGPGNPYGGSYMPATPQQPQAPMHFAGSPTQAYAGAGPVQPQSAGGHPMGGPHAGQAGAVPAQGQPAMQGLPGQPMTQQIFIPNDMVGAIIGKGGQKINEIRQFSGSVIKINEPSDNSNERLVTITGTQECNQMALYMLYSRLARPSHSATIYLAITGLALLLLERCTPTLLQPSRKSLQSDYELDSLSAEPRSPPLKTQALGRSRWSLAAVFLVLLIFVRIEVFRRVTGSVQCSIPSIELLLLPLLALYHTTPMPTKDDRSRASHILVFYSRQLILPASFMTLGSGFLAFSRPALRSTYICSSSSSSWILVFQLAAVVLDSLIISLAVSILKQSTASGLQSNRLKSSLSSIILTSVFAMLGLGAITYWAAPEKRQWLISIPSPYIWTAVTQCIVLAFITICALYLALRMSIVSVVIIIVFVCTCLPAIASGWMNPEFASSPAFIVLLLAFGLVYAGLFFAYSIETSTESTNTKSARLRVYATKAAPLYIFTTLFLLQLYLSSSKSPTSPHPITTLIRDAKSSHEAWLSQAGSSASLRDAVNNYKNRYGRLPPPGFDKWYEFAVSRGSVVIDDFDGVDADLMPFWSVSPKDLRFRTWQVTANSFNDVFPISIRDGKTDLGPNRLPTHRWMLEGFADLIGSFVEWIPDMDLAINPNDECRVSVDWESRQSMLSSAKQTKSLDRPADTRWSPSRGSQWLSPDEEESTDSSFVEASFLPSYHSFLARTCPPSSKARQDYDWNTRDVCVSCAAPHSYGPFMANWTLAADPCHQPDLAYLHGFFISPSAYKGTSALLPIFSQSKVQGYGDIVYPSPWNYMGKVKYEPTEEHKDEPLANKKPALFWRGATSEGMAIKGGWQGMVRQRLVFMSNTTHTNSQTSLLVSDVDGSSSIISNIPISSAALPSTDIGVVSKIERCRDVACDDEASDLGFKEGVDFQAHWGFKYLMDLDGAGFSGRFIPFLKSRSVPFKSALFREWYDSRITAWLHFVPQDVRLHGLYSTLVYFAGMEGTVGGKKVKMEARDKEAALIAEEGREWAHKALRREDMEIYMFRLLLEWGRLTDDKRDSLGFTI